MNATKISVLILAAVLVMIGVARTETSSQSPPTPHGGLQQAATPVDAAPTTPGSIGRSPLSSASPILDNEARKISFQALLTNDQGNPIPMPNGDHTLDFFFYDTDVGGVPIGEVLNVVVTLDGGVASTQVGPLDPTWFDGTGRWMGITVDDIDDDPVGDELEPRIPLGGVPYAFRVDRVANEELDDHIALGDSNTSGSLTVFSGGLDVVTITLDGPTGELGVFNPAGQGRVIVDGGSPRITISGDDGNEHAALWGSSWGELLLSDTTGDTTAGLRAVTIGGSGANLFLSDETGSFGLFAHATTAGGELLIYDTVTNLPTVSLTGSDGGMVDVRNFDGASTIKLDGTFHQMTTFGSDGMPSAEIRGAAAGVILLYDSSVSNDLTVSLSATDDSGGQIKALRTDGQPGVFLWGSSTGGVGRFFNASPVPVQTIELDGDEGDGGALFTMSDGSNITIDMDANGAGGGAGVILRNSNGDRTLVLDADTSDHAAIRLWDSLGNNTVEIEARENAGSTGGQIILRDSNGIATIFLDAEFGVGGDGRITTEVLEITGGADLSEQFNIGMDTHEVKPGMVVCIDAEHPGRLVVCTHAYDRTVAGIISGAGGVKPGMLMGQKGSSADGAFPVALTGRVYVWADASNGPIQPGDLLTTTDAPGHAMKVTDYARAHGAIIGKAMTSLQEGTGLVLVLVALQ